MGGANFAVSWKPPPAGWIKMNTDGSFVGRDSSGGAGYVARDSNGRLVFAGASDCRGFNPLYSELSAMRSALAEANKAGFRRVILESDSSAAVDLVRGTVREARDAPRGTKQLVQQCQDLSKKFPEIVIQHTYREGNGVADCLAAVGRRLTGSRFFGDFDELPDEATKGRFIFDIFGGASLRRK